MKTLYSPLSESTMTTPMSSSFMSVVGGCSTWCLDWRSVARRLQECLTSVLSSALLDWTGDCIVQGHQPATQLRLRLGKISLRQKVSTPKHSLQLLQLTEFYVVVGFQEIWEF